MRILHVLDHSLPAHSGYSFRTAAILAAQRARGWSTEQLTGNKHPDPAGEEEEAGGFRFHRTLSRGGLGGRLPVLRQAATVATLRRRLMQVARAVRPDVLHAHSPCLVGMAAIAVGRALGIPVVYEVRAFWEDAAVDHGTSSPGGVRYRISRRLETRVLRRADAVVCISEGLRADIVARGIPADAVTVVPNAVDAGALPYRAPRDRDLVHAWGLEGRRVIGFCGSFYRYEGLDLLLDALLEVRERFPDACAVLVGGGEQAEALRAQAVSAGLDEHVRFTGRVANEEIGRYYGLMDACVFPRRSMRLTELVTPLKPLEAMALGRPVIASDVGGHRELIRPGETGVLFDAGDGAALARAIAELFADPEGADRRCAAARRFVETERTWERVVARYEAVYESAAARRAARGR